MSSRAAGDGNTEFAERPLCATSGRPKNYHFEISSFRALRSAAAVLPIGDLTFETVPNERNLRNRKRTSH
jgi:hypothetical protein